MMPGDSESRNNATFAGSLVSGATTKGSSAYTSRPTSPPLRRCSSEASVARACASRDGGRSDAAMPPERSSAMTSGMRTCHSGCALRCHDGPASASSASSDATHANTTGHQRCNFTRCASSRRCGSRCASTRPCHGSRASIRRRQPHASSGNAAMPHNQAGRRKCSAAKKSGRFMRGATMDEAPPAAAMRWPRPAARDSVRSAAAPAARRAAPAPLVDLRIDAREFGGVARAEGLAAGRARDRLQGRLVDVVAAARQADRQPEHRQRGAAAAQGDGVDADAVRPGQFRRLQGVQLAGGVDAVGEQHEGALVVPVFAAGLHALDRQADRVADRGLAPGQAHPRVEQLLAHGIEVRGDRGQRVGALAEDDQADPIAGPTIEEIGDHRFRRGQPIHGLVAQHHVLVAHAAGEIDGEHQLASRLRRHHRRAQLLRPCGGDAQQDPAEPGQPVPAARVPRDPALPGDTVQPLAKGHPQGGALHPRRAPCDPQEPGQRQRQQQPWPGPCIDAGKRECIHDARIHSRKRRRARACRAATSAASTSRRKPPSTSSAPWPSSNRASRAPASR